MGTHKGRRSQWCNRLSVGVTRPEGGRFWFSGERESEKGKEVKDSEAHTFGYGSRPRYGGGGSGDVHACIRQNNAGESQRWRPHAERGSEGRSDREPEPCWQAPSGTELVRASILTTWEEGRAVRSRPSFLPSCPHEFPRSCISTVH